MKGKKLEPYCVGENDYVLAFDVEQAVELLRIESGCSVSDMEGIEVENLSGQLDKKLYEEDGKYISTLGEFIAGMTEPTYLFGWE